ncbi:hypothetical protein [Sagittula sp. S175]|uniref:hypothetical protein n=1 Tax=Sagittula sp. S175 TaxID=3415129 RepID=UPI003C7BF32C
MRCVKSFPFIRQGAAHPERRLTIFARDSEGFGIVEQYFYRSVDDDGSVIAEGWASLPVSGIFADAKGAEREIEALLPEGAEGRRGT